MLELLARRLERWSERAWVDWRPWLAPRLMRANFWQGTLAP